METMIYYKCDNCNEIHGDSNSIYKCKICGTEICIDCSTDDGLCFDYCEEEKLSPRETIEKFIKNNRYSYKVEDILEEYKNKYGKSYVSYTMEHCCKSLKHEIEALIINETEED